MSAPDPAEAPRDPRTAFAELSKIMLGEEPLSATLAQVAELAKQTIPGAAEVSVTLIQNERVESLVFTGPLASDLDERQYEAGFGPCMDAALSGTTVVIEDTSDSPTYTDFGRAAYRKGITRTMSIGLPAQRRTVGALNVYATDGGAFDQTAQELALTFAGYAAVALANAGLYASTSQLAANLQRALESRAIIDQAKGILMARHGVSADEAFDMISRQSQLTNRKVRDIAAELAADAGRGRRD